MTDHTDFPIGTVALRTTENGAELYLRATGHDDKSGWISAGDPLGHDIIALDELVEEFADMSDYESYRLHVADDPSAPTLHFDGSEEWEGVPESFGEFDGRVNTRTAIRTATIRALLAEQPLGTIVYFDSDEDSTDRNVAYRIEDGWPSTTNACAFIADDEDDQGGWAVDPETLTAIHIRE